MSARPDAQVRSGAERRFALIRTDLIDVVSTRGRGERQFQENVRSIADVGLYKPVLVNTWELERTGRYQLICGEGRLRAHLELKREMIKAELVSVDLATAHLMSLGENMTKSPPKSIEFAYALLEMHERGADSATLERITGQQAHYINRYINLVKKGEDRLIKGVEQGLFPLDFAMRVAETPDAAIQHVLMDAFDRKLITAKHVESVRRILQDRTRHGKELKPGSARRQTGERRMSADDLRRDMARITKEREGFVFAVENKEARLTRLLVTLRDLQADAVFVALSRRADLGDLPTLEGTYGGL